jgi:lipopolysaccharide export system protein LptA
MSVTADTLVADYREGKEKKTEIYRLTATGHVVLTSGENKAYGENAVYTMDDGKAVLTGGDLKIVGKDMTITAKDRFEYYANEGRMVAIGAPVITNLDRTLTADKVTAWTAPQTKDGAGEAKKPEAASTAKSLGNLQRALAEGNVVITTPKEKATSDKATYTAQTDLVELTGNVKLNQGINQLEGERAEMNMATNVSRIFGAPGKGGRVKGVFFPGSQSK